MKGMKPEDLARQEIDEMLIAAGWIVQDRQKLNLGAGLGVAIREFSLRTGAADYFLMVNREAVGVVEAKPHGHSLLGVKEQSAKYLTGMDDDLPAARVPLPFHYETTGEETRFTRPSGGICYKTVMCIPCCACPPASFTLRASKRMCSFSTSARPAPTPRPSGCGSMTCAPT